MKATILFKTDFWHTYSSQEVIGIYTNKAKLKKDVKAIIKKDIENSKEFEDKEEMKEYINYNFDFLFSKNQTQGLKSFELVMEEVKANEIF